MSGFPIEEIFKENYEPDVKVEDFEEEKIKFSMEMLVALYNEEYEKLKDPNYPGGGHNPRYGPRVTV
jgi:hypothetical protein